MLHVVAWYGAGQHHLRQPAGRKTSYIRKTLCESVLQKILFNITNSYLMVNWKMKNFDSIRQNWQNIENWLDNKARDYDRNVIASGVDKKVLELFQQEFQVILPVDFRQSYLLHNGFNEKIGLIHSGDLLSISEIKQLYHRLTNKNFLKKWDKKQFPFVEFYDNDFLCIDFTNYKIYRIEINLETLSIENTYVTYNSFAAFLSDFVNDLILGHGIMGEMFCE